jgi:hypothetical protein
MAVKLSTFISVSESCLEQTLSASHITATKAVISCGKRVAIDQIPINVKDEFNL